VYLVLRIDICASVHEGTAHQLGESWRHSFFVRWSDMVMPGFRISACKMSGDVQRCTAKLFKHP